VKLAVAVALLLLLLGAAALLLYMRARRARAGARRLGRAAKKLKHPVVLAHGLFGVEKIGFGGIEREYFRGVRARLLSQGADVHVVKVSAFASVESRAKQFADGLKAISAKRVNVIAHSMGGLDARYAISRLDVARKVASLVTIGTPHRGTPLADLGTSFLGDTLGLRRMLEALGLDVDAFYDLTTSKMDAFNRQVPDAKGVFYGCLLARANGGLNPLLMPGHLFLKRKHGDNDGLVPAESQRWGEVVGEVDADHWAQIGWSDGIDTPSLYLRVVEELKGRGL
jgi:triacylglycerol lipase